MAQWRGLDTITATTQQQLSIGACLGTTHRFLRPANVLRTVWPTLLEDVRHVVVLQDVVLRWGGCACLNAHAMCMLP
eukprot:364787-Chlamydomonas_euryale.AAC.22